MDMISMDKLYNGMEAKLGDVVYVRWGAGEANNAPQEVVYVGKDAFVVESSEGELTVYGKDTTGMGIFTVVKVLLVNGFEVPAPLDALPTSGEVFIASPTAPAFYLRILDVRKSVLSFALSRGLLYASRADAIACAKAMVGINPAGINPTERESLDDAYDNLP